MLGLREMAIVAAAVLVLYGRTGVLRSQRFQSIWPWIAPVRRKTGPSPASPVEIRKPRRFQLEGNRLFWFLTILASTAVATTIVARMLILRGTAPVPHP